MKRQLIAAVAVSLALGCGSAAAQTIFLDNFNTETFGLNATPSQWTMLDGTVDIIGSGPNGSGFDFLPGNGYYIDLDGSTANAGIMSRTLSLNAGVLYNLRFDLAGDQRNNGLNTVNYGVDFTSDGILDAFASASLPSAQGFTTLDLSFASAVATTSARIVFDHLGGDNIGLLLDNVSVTVVPEPETYGLLLAGLGLLGFMARRRAVRRS